MNSFEGSLKSNLKFQEKKFKNQAVTIFLDKLCCSCFETSFHLVADSSGSLNSVVSMDVECKLVDGRQF